MKKSELYEQIEAGSARSAWDRGVKTYALEMVEEIEGDELPDDPNEYEALLLNGARNWAVYSWGGCALCYDTDIAERLCTPSELKRKKGGELPPNRVEEWLDVQSRALCQAYRKIMKAVRQILRRSC